MQTTGCLKLESLNSEIYGYQALIGLGAGSFTHTGFAVIQATVNLKDGVFGVTLIMLGQLCSLAVGLSVTGALFINLAKSNLQAVFPTVDGSTLISIVLGTSFTLHDARQHHALITIVSTLQDVFTNVYVVAALAFILCVFLKVLSPPYEPCSFQANKAPVEKGLHGGHRWWNVGM